MSIFFDSSTLISMAVTCSLPILRKLKQAYAGPFYITSSVYAETVDRALHSLRFRYEGYRIKELIEDGIIAVYSDAEFLDQINSTMSLINNTYFTANGPLPIVQIGEMSAITACIKEHATALVVDERAARLLIENPAALKPWLEHKFHTPITVSESNMKKWASRISGKFVPLRSAELALAAWERGILGNNKDVLFGLLWELKFAGCAVSEDEINFYSARAA